MERLVKTQDRYQRLLLEYNTGIPASRHRVIQATIDNERYGCAIVRAGRFFSPYISHALFTNRSSWSYHV